MDKSSYEKGHDFEKIVLKILYRTNPYKIKYHDGGSDRGRDLVVSYLIDNVTYDVIVQCKCYKNSVKIEDISSSLDWIKIYRPALFYIWVCPYLTSGTKDYLEQFSSQYNISIDYEEKANIDIYLNELSKNNSEILKTLKRRIFSNIIKYPQYEKGQFSKDECYLVDREKARKALMDESYNAFLIQGVSCCGKTQLLKNLSFYYYNQRKKIFWFTFHESNIEIQLKSFWTSLSLFLIVEFNDYNLQNYFKIYGYHITPILHKEAIYLLTKYKFIIIIDDIHKCSMDNIELRDFFISVITKKVTIIFFAGWFNIFDLTPIVEKNIRNITLDGLESKDINEIIIHNTGKGNFSVAQKIVNDYNGLPGFAAIVDSNTHAKDFESDKTFLYSIIDYLNEKEKELIFAFVYTTVPLPDNLFSSVNYYDAFRSLLKRKLVLKQENGYIIHDKYRSILLTYPLDNDLQNIVINTLEIFSHSNLNIILNIVKLYYQQKQFDKALIKLNENFDELLHKIPPIDILEYYQLVEKELPLDYDKKKIMLKKVVLLERCEQYDLCQFYIDILKDSVNTQEDWEKLFYSKLRCDYFTNMYDELLETADFYHIKVKELSSKRTVIQTLLIIGRIYYIRGLFKQALYFYLLAYEQAFIINDKILIVKIIHRIAMVEMKLGYVREAYFTFRVLLSLDSLITLKRKSYIYYRIAECEYKFNEYCKAIKNNQESLHIKESINHKRGLIFSHRLSAKIALKEDNYVKADLEIENALNISRDLHLHKEELACALVKFKIHCKANIPFTDILHNSLEEYLKVAIREKNLYRLHQIAKATKNIYDDIYEKAQSSEKSITPKLIEQYTHISNSWSHLYSEQIRVLYNEAVYSNNAITKKLLFKSGLYDPLA